jgi:hypothetical protein
MCADIGTRHKNANEKRGRRLAREAIQLSTVCSDSSGLNGPRNVSPREVIYRPSP